MAILSPNKLYKDLDLSFSAHPQTKDVLKKIDINAIRQSLKLLIFTQYGEKLFKPDVGSPMYALLFEPIDPITTETIRRSIENLITNYEPRVLLDYIDVVPNYDDNEYEISIFFTVLGVSQPASLTLTLQRLR
jgi:phage baseplate assembly protein W